MPSLTVYIAVALACFFIGVSKSGFGGLLTALITPLVALALPADKALGVMLPVLMIGDVFAVYAHWRNWDLRLFRLLTVGAVAGVALATLVLSGLSPTGLRLVLGAFTLAFAVYRLLERKLLGALRYQPHAWHGVLSGAIAGFASALANQGTPPVNIYLLMQDLTPSVFVGTTAITFLVMNWIKLPFYYSAHLFDPHLLLRLAWLAPLIPLGSWAGKRFLAHMNQARFNTLLTVLLFISGLLLVTR